MRDLLVLQNIAAYDTHILAHAQFLSRFENNHSAFIRIKTESTKQSQTIVIPLEIEVKKGLEPSQSLKYCGRMCAQSRRFLLLQILAYFHCLTR